MNAKLLLTLIAVSAVASLDLMAQDSNQDRRRNRRERQESIRDNLRLELTDEQRAAIDAHRAVVQEKHEQLNEILKEDAEYLALSEDTDLTRDERHELVTLRRELIAGSADAQAKLDEIKALNAAFREENPDLPGRPGIRPRINEIKEINQELKTLLSTDSAIAALLAIDNKSEEEFATLRDLRHEFIANSEEAQELIAKKRQLKNSVRDRIRERRGHNRPDNPRIPGSSGDRTTTGNASDHTSK